jgi:PadR family transcriptional regulator, regulatory protein PadR
MALRILRLSMGKNDLLPGTLDMMVLKTLTRGALHGYAIAQLLKQLSSDVLQVEEGSLYPALQRLELNGWIEGEWGVSSNNRRARFYRLTPEGRKTLASESARYCRMAGAIARVMGMA